MFQKPCALLLHKGEIVSRNGNVFAQAPRETTNTQILVALKRKNSVLFIFNINILPRSPRFEWSCTFEVSAERRNVVVKVLHQDAAGNDVVGPERKIYVEVTVVID